VGNPNYAAPVLLAKLRQSPESACDYASRVLLWLCRRDSDVATGFSYHRPRSRSISKLNAPIDSRKAVLRAGESRTRYWSRNVPFSSASIQHGLGVGDTLWLRSIENQIKALRTGDIGMLIVSASSGVGTLPLRLHRSSRSSFSERCSGLMGTRSNGERGRWQPCRKA
jgi:hypothetical protein